VCSCRMGKQRLVRSSPSEYQARYKMVLVLDITVAVVDRSQEFKREVVRGRSRAQDSSCTIFLLMIKKSA
jgi:hypothetical protein